MKKWILILFFVGCEYSLDAHRVYLWENINTLTGSHSCCLCFAGTDICNPNIPCTNNQYVDVAGIYDYIARLLSLDKSACFSFATLLNQAQYYIRYILRSTRTIWYVREEQRDVVFFDQLIDTCCKPCEKPLKPCDTKSATKSSTTSTSSTSSTDKQKQEDKVFKYLVSLGMAKPFDKKF